MIRIGALLVSVPLLLGAGGCAKKQTPYKSAMSAAEEARRDDSFAQERSHFTEAARAAKKPKDAGEARYRRAHSWVREGDYGRGATELENFASTYPQAIRAARAWLDAGRAWEKAGHLSHALRAFNTVIQRYPDSGNALAAAKRIVALREESEKKPSREIWRTLLEANTSSELDEELRYHYAKSLEAHSVEQAVLTYEDVARRHPLPHGSYADEALLRAAQLRREKGDPEGAIKTVELLLEQGGPAAIVGSYTRTAYIKGLFLQGLILRDDLNHTAAALEVFESLPEKFPHSRLVDDALWEAVRSRLLDGKNGCEGLVLLKKKAPESRYTRCEDFLCDSAPVAEKQRRECEGWLSLPTLPGP